MQPLSTVNVIETIGGVVRQVVSYPDDARGIKPAEELFSRLARENDSTLTDPEIQAGLDDGYIDVGDYTVSIVHSNTD